MKGLFTHMLFALYTLVAIIYVVSYLVKRKTVRYFSLGAFIFALLVNTYVILQRWSSVHQPPFQTLYESLIFFCWCTAFVYILIEVIFKWRFVGALVAGFCMALLLYAQFSDNAIRKLPPALQSAYFVPHVLLYFLAYGAFAISFITSCIYLIKRRLKVQQLRSDALDLYTDRAISLGLPFLTFGLILGALWAKKAWGGYWSWDPKETWSLITWLIYVIYIHLRFVKRWQGVRASWFAVAGFLALLLTYLGMTLLPTAGKSPHVYL